MQSEQPDIVYAQTAVQNGYKFRPGGRFSKAPETFRARKAIAKSQTLRLQSCEINKF